MASRHQVELNARMLPVQLPETVFTPSHRSDNPSYGSRPWNSVCNRVAQGGIECAIEHLGVIKIEMSPTSAAGLH